MSAATLEANRIFTALAGDTVGRDEAGNTYYRSACGRCGGQGIIQGYYFNQGGICFKCNGNGGFGPWIAEDVWNAEVARKQAQAEKRQEAKARKIAREAQANLENVLSAHGADLFEGLTDESPAFVRDILNKASRFGSISEAQASAVRKALAPKPEQQEAEAKPVPCGRVRLTGKILRIKSQDSPWGTQTKMLLQGDGWKVYGTFPAGLEGNEGDEVSFTATVEAKPGEPSFGFFSRPKA